jgi:hypothetical protein
LEKEPDDKTKLRPLGVPSAIRRIAGILILNEYAPTFADYLLPYNYAIGVNGGIDLIIKTIQFARLSPKNSPPSKHTLISSMTELVKPLFA